MKKCILFLMVLAGSAGADSPLQLIPAPQRVWRQNGEWTLGRGIDILITAQADTFAARLLAEELTPLAGRTPRIRLGKGKAIRLLRWGQSKKEKQWEAAWGDSIASNLGKEGYVLEVSPKGVTVSANTDQGVFYGIQTLRQLIRSEGRTLPALRIADWPMLKYRGWQDDISRGPIPTMDFLKEQVRILSEYKLNFFTLYTEHVFKLKSHPDIAPPDGITAEEIAELQSYARQYHVELVGNFQSFGHFYHILKLPAYRHLRETRHVISPAFEETYQFLGDAFAEVAQAYESPLFNINCDETFGLGSGPAKQMMKELGKEGLYAYHINRIAALFSPYKKRLMMWGDIAREYPGIIPRLPKDLIVLPWGYHAAPSFDREILPFTKLGFDFIVCPGVSCWGRIWPDFETAIKNIAHFVRDGAKLGALGMLNTSWDDDGENLFQYHWWPMVWGAEMAWKPLSPGETSALEDRLVCFNQAFGSAFYGMGKENVTELFFALDDLKRHQASGALVDKAFWQPLVSSAAGAEAPPEGGPDLALKARTLAAAFDRGAEKTPRHPVSLKAAGFAARRIAVMGLMAALRRRIWEIGDRHSEVDLGGIEQDLLKLRSDISGLKEEYTALWNLEARPWWLEKNQLKYDALLKEVNQVNGFVRIQPDADVLAPRRRMTLSAFLPEEQIYYSLDGSEVSGASLRYEGPFEIEKSGTIRARVVRSGVWLPESQRHIHVYEGPVKSIALTHSYADQYAAEGLVSLVDGIRGSEDFTDGNWHGYLYDDFVAVFDMGESRPIEELGLSCLQASRSWILFPREIVFETSDDGMNYLPLAELPVADSDAHDGVELAEFRVPYLSTLKRSARYIRITARNAGLLPRGHASAGAKAWLFIDEVLLR